VDHVEPTGTDWNSSSECMRWRSCRYDAHKRVTEISSRFDHVRKNGNRSGDIAENLQAVVLVSC